MVTAIEDQVPVLVKDPLKSLPETRVGRVVKKTKDKKQWKGLPSDTLLELIEDASVENGSPTDLKEKKQQGIVIDGKTYTCATCKTGHRVGVCKHARDRPMTATHPPGRPPAGAPKKIVCDCPKTCSCKKRDCKCARKCSCTQAMYMLVYLPAPGEEHNSDDEKGTWKLGEEVTTDLKGNVLSPEQIKERQQLKVAQRNQHIGSMGSNFASEAASEPRSSRSPDTKASSNDIEGCCTHKRAVFARNVAAEELLLSPSTEIVPSSTDGCNCGKSCSCAFCPEHPNNSTSMNIAREQLKRFANQPHDFKQQFIIPISPTSSNPASCMGGQPRFAMSNFPYMPTIQDMAQTFQSQGPGYMIGYPMQMPLGYGTEWPTPPLPMQQQFAHDLRIVNSTGTPLLQTPMATPRIDSPDFEFTPDLFDIGNACVTSAGPGVWNNDFLSPDHWAVNDPVPTPVINTVLESPTFFAESPVHANMAPAPVPDGFLDFHNDLVGHGHDIFFDVPANTHAPPRQEVDANQPSQRSCCHPSLTLENPHGNYRAASLYPAALSDSISPGVIPPSR